MKCPSCNNSISDKVKYCERCGFMSPNALFYINKDSFVVWNKQLNYLKRNHCVNASSNLKHQTGVVTESIQSSCQSNSKQLVQNYIESYCLTESNLSYQINTTHALGSPYNPINLKCTEQSAKNGCVWDVKINNEKSIKVLLNANSNLLSDRYFIKIDDVYYYFILSTSQNISNQRIQPDSSLLVKKTSTQSVTSSQISNNTTTQIQENKNDYKLSKGNSIASMILGVLSVLFSLTGFSFVFFPEGIVMSFGLLVAAIICSVICFTQYGKSKRLGKTNGFARAGKATGVVGLILSLAFGVICVFFVIEDNKLLFESDTILERIGKMDVVASGSKYTIYSEEFNNLIIEARWWDYDSTMDKPGMYNTDTETLAFSIEVNEDAEDDIYYAYYYSKDKEFDKDDLYKPIYSETISPVEYSDGRVYYNVDYSKKIQKGYYVVIVASKSDLSNPYVVAYANVV